MYHNTCWIKAKREAETNVEFVREDEYVKALSDVEIIHFVEKQLLDPSGKVLDMTILNDTYKSILHANGVSQENISSNYKKYLKDLILKNITEITFIKNKNPSKPDQLISTCTQSEVIDSSIKECTTDNMEKIWNVAKSIRKEILSREKWQYTGSFDGFCLPPLLSTLVKWVLIGK